MTNIERKKMGNIVVVYDKDDVLLNHDKTRFVGSIGNASGAELLVTEYDGHYYWCIPCHYNDLRWEEIPESLYIEAVKHDETCSEGVSYQDNVNESLVKKCKECGKVILQVCASFCCSSCAVLATQRFISDNFNGSCAPDGFGYETAKKVVSIIETDRRGFLDD